MKLSNATQNFWSQIKNYILASVITIALAFYFYGWQVGSTITFFLVLCFLWLLTDIKEKLIRSLPDSFEYETAAVEDYPFLNFNWLQRQTEELQSLGFVQIMDYKPSKTSAFGRCFAHPEQYCYAEVNEIFQPNGESFSRNAAIMSGLDQGWSLGSVNREVNNNSDSFSYGFWNNPKNVRIYYPETRLEELFHKHLQMRQQMINDIGISLLTDVSWNNYVEKQQEAAIYRKRSVRQKMLLLAMIEMTKFELNPKSEWWGDYAKFIRQKR